MQGWFDISLTQVMGIFLSVILMYIAIIVLIKINGLRSFSKMSGHDFAVTIAIGSILGASVLQKDPSISQAIISIVALFIIQSLFSFWRITRPSNIVENKPLLLMKDGKILDENLTKSKVTHADLIAKLREANVTQMKQVKAVVLEQTGDVSVLHSDDDLDSFLIKDVDTS